MLPFILCDLYQQKVLEKHTLLQKKMFNFNNYKMNLENLNLVELNAQEVETTEGGTWIEFLYELADHWGDVKDGFMDGWHAGHP